MSTSKQTASNIPTGMICLAKILTHFGTRLDEPKFVKQHERSDQALLWDDLRKTARHYHLRSQLLHATLDELREIPVPAIAKMKSGTYVVIVVNNDEAVYLIDPRLQQPVALAQKQFADAWSGEVLIFSARYSFAYFKKKYNLDWFLRVIAHYKRYLGEVMLAAFFLQLMGIGMPLITQVIIDKVIGNQGWSTLTVIGVSMVIFFLLQAILSGLRTYLLNHTTIKLDAILGTRLFHHLISLPLPYYESRRVGDTLMRVGAMSSIREFLTGQALMTILDVLFSVVFIAFMLWYSVPLTLIALIVVPLYIVQNIWAIPIIKRKIEAVWRTGAANNAFMVEAVTGIETIKALAVEPQFDHKWEDLLARYVRTTFENVKFRLVIGGFSGIMQTVTSLLILWYGGHLVMDGYFTLGQLIAFQPLPEQVHGLHFWGVLGRVGGGQEHAAFRDFADFAVDGGEEVALVRCRMLPEEHTRIDGGFPFQTGNQRETFPVEPDQLGRRPVAETLRHPVDEMETGIVEDLETLLHDSPPISCGTGCTGPCGMAPCRAFRGISCSCRGGPPCGRG